MALTHKYGDTLFEHRVDRNTGSGYCCLSYKHFKSYLKVHNLDKMSLDTYKNEPHLGKSRLEDTLKARYQFLNTRANLVALPNGKKVSFAHAEIFFKSESIFAQCKVAASYERLGQAQSDFKQLKAYVQNEIINMESKAIFGNTKAFNILKKLENINQKDMQQYLTTAIKQDLELYKPASFFTSCMRFFRC